MVKYASMYERLVANTELAIPDNPQSCWLWTGSMGTAGYPQVTVRVPGVGPRARRAHRAVLEEVLDAEFPLDEAGHLCFTPRCVHPEHLEVQTVAANLSQRRGYAACAGSWIPTLFPRGEYEPQWEPPPPYAGPCPF